MAKGKTRNFVDRKNAKEKDHESIMERANNDFCKKVGAYRRALVLFEKGRIFFISRLFVSWGGT
jgi:hypothetical protein